MFWFKHTSPSTPSALSQRQRLVGLVGLILLAVLGVGCGPIQSTHKISQAEVALERARVVEAHRKAPYEYFSAKNYLHKAKEEWGYSNFEASFDYANQAKRAAEAALLKAKEDPWPGSPVKKAKAKKADKKDQQGSSAAPSAGDGSQGKAGDGPTS